MNRLVSQKEGILLVRSLKYVLVATAALAALLVSPRFETIDTSSPDPMSGLASVEFSSPADLFVVKSAEAQRAPRPACNLKAFPMVAGIEWVYEARAIPGRAPPKQPPPKPVQPEKVTIKILTVTKEGPITTIELEESSDYGTVKTTLTCERDKLNVPMNSFFFAGEPGGGLNVEVTDVERTGNSYLFRLGKVQIPEWTEEVKGKFTRTPPEGSKAMLFNGSFDLQRVVLIGLPEPVSTDLGDLSASPVQVDLRGSVTLDSTPEPYTFSVPANTISKLWFAENLGVVQVFNPNSHLYMLTAINKPGDAAKTP